MGEAFTSPRRAPESDDASLPAVAAFTSPRRAPESNDASLAAMTDEEEKSPEQMNFSSGNIISGNIIAGNTTPPCYNEPQPPSLTESPRVAASAASGASSFRLIPPPPLREDRGEMSVTAYMHKSLTSKLSLTSRSTLTKWAIDGATKPKTWWGKMLGATGGFLASVVAAPVTAISAVGGYLRNKSEAKKQQEKITFYWRGNDLWCRFPQSTCVRNIRQAHKPQVHDPRDLYQETKVAGIHGIFNDQKIVIRFAKTRGYQTASDRVIDTGSAYKNLKETLL